MPAIYTDKAGQRFLVGVEVDQDAIVNQLWNRALKNKSSRATAMRGAISVEIKSLEGSSHG